MHHCNLVSVKNLFVLRVNRSDRWEIRRRLSELEIRSYCDLQGHLSVAIDTAVDVVQVRSVVRSFLEPRESLRQGLELCWGLSLEAHP